jgi:ribose-phosphate pyrophosphokinase
VVTDTIPLRYDIPHVRQVSVAELLAETIKRISNGASIKDLS